MMIRIESCATSQSLRNQVFVSHNMNVDSDEDEDEESQSLRNQVFVSH